MRLHCNASHINALRFNALHINALHINLHINDTLEICSFLGGRPWSGRCLRNCNLYIVSCVSIARNSFKMRLARAGTVAVLLKMCFLIVRFVILLEFEGSIARKLRFHIFNFSNLKDASHESVVIASSTFRIWRKHRTKALFSYLQPLEFVQVSWYEAVLARALCKLCSDCSAK